MNCMMTEHLTFFIYGMCIMFYSMMVWFFWRKGSDVLSRLIALLMAVLDMECVKDLALYPSYFGSYEMVWHVSNSIDMLVIPIYIFVLMELVKPGWLSWRKAVMHEASFAVPLALYSFTDNVLWFDALAVWGFIYGTATYVLMFFFINQYHRQLKDRFSYQDNINLNWLRGILSCFFVILLIWTLSCYMVNAVYDNVYMLFSLGAWMFVCYFLYKHESVIEELSELDVDSEADDSDGMGLPELKKMVDKAFIEDKLYLNPQLKLSDVARKVGTNRTYLSRFFNQDMKTTFYDYVNNLRMNHAEGLLKKTDLTLNVIAEQSGFNSISTFRRAFMAKHNCTPSEYRKKN